MSTTIYKMNSTLTHPVLGVMALGTLWNGAPSPADPGVILVLNGLDKMPQPVNAVWLTPFVDFEKLVDVTEMTDAELDDVIATAEESKCEWCGEAQEHHPECSTLPEYPNGKVYVSGPMTGIADFNYPAFDRAEATLRSLGYDVVNPAKMDAELGTDGLAWQDFLARDLHAILSDPDMTGVVFIDGWRNSRGATLEGYVAQQAGKSLWELVVTDAHPEIATLHPVETVSVAYAAQSVVLGARRFAYGHPLDNFLKIGELFNATIGHKLTEPLDVRDVAMLMLQVKVAREYNSPKEDNMVDVCGYALAYSEALNEIEARGGSRESFLSTNAALLRQHAVVGADSAR